MSDQALAFVFFAGVAVVLAWREMGRQKLEGYKLALRHLREELRRGKTAAAALAMLEDETLSRDTGDK